VTRTTADYPSACGARIIAIEGRPIEEVLDLVETVISHDNEYWARFRSQQFLQGVEILQTLGLVPADGVADFTFAQPGGAEFTLSVRPISTPQAMATIFAPDPVSERTPLFRRNPNVNYWSSWVPEERTMYIQYNVCANASSEDFATFVKRVFATIDVQLPNRLVVDLRGNAGGSDSVIGPLFDALRARPWLNDPGRLFVLIGNRTFSSAVINTIYFNVYTRATLVGEPTGGNANAYGEVKTFTLPRHAIMVWHSTKSFEFDSIHPGAVMPDVMVRPDSYDYFANRDPVLEAIWGRGGSVTPLGLPAARRRPLSYPRPRFCPN